jgi:environmental stress-induced protein Ves
MRRLRATDYLAMPWKDGGGTTTQIHIHPEGAGVASGFDWRLSMAQVERGGPFSRFERCDRHLLLLEGEGMELRVDGRLHRMDAPLTPFAFPGEAEVTATLLGGPCRDFNLIVRREGWRSALTVITAAGLLPDAPVSALFALQALSVDGLELEAGDTLLDAKGHLSGSPVRAILAQLWPRG